MVNNAMIATMEAALENARNELSYAFHLEDYGKNAGIRKIWSEREPIGLHH